MSIGIGTAAVFAAAIIGSILWKNNNDIPIIEPATLEATTEEATEKQSTLHLEEDERILVPIDELSVSPDFGYANPEAKQCLVFDREMNLVGRFAGVWRTDFKMDDFWGVENFRVQSERAYGIPRPFTEGKEGFIIASPDREKAGVWSVETGEWVIRPEYDFISPFSGDRYLAYLWKDGLDGDQWFLFDQNGDKINEGWNNGLFDERGDYLVNSQTCQIFNRDGNLVYAISSGTYPVIGATGVYGIAGDVAAVVPDGRDVTQFVDLTTGEILEEVPFRSNGDGGQNLLKTGNFLTVYNETNSESEEKLAIFDAKEKKLVTVEDFCSQNKMAAEPGDEIRILGYHSETNELLVLKENRSESGRNMPVNAAACYVCNSDLTVKKTYQGSYLIMNGLVSGFTYFPDTYSDLLGIISDGENRQVIDFWSGETYVIPEEIADKEISRMVKLTDGWYLFEFTDENGAASIFVTCKDQVVEQDVQSCESWDGVLSLGKESSQRIYYRLEDGKKLEIIESAEQAIVSVSAYEIVVEDIRSQELVFYNWDQEELGRVEIPAE